MAINNRIVLFCRGFGLDFYTQFLYLLLILTNLKKALWVSVQLSFWNKNRTTP